MRILVCGAGRVGSGIAHQLAKEGNDVTVVDQSPELIQRLQENLDVRGMVGHGAYPDVLDRAGAGDADMLIAVTFSDEVNMIASQIAHSLFQTPIKIARVRSQAYLKPEYQNLFTRDHMPIDVIISPELEVGRSVLRRLQTPGAFDTVDFAEGKVQMIGVRVEPGAPVVNTQLRQLGELFPDLNSRVVAIWRSERLFVPSSTDQIMLEDEVYFVSDRKDVERALSIFGHDEKAARRVVIVGGGNIGIYTARELETRQSRVKVKLIERDRARAERAADQLARTLVLHGSGLDQGLLKEAGVQESETIVAVTNDDEVNILTSLIGKKLGCERALTLINNPEYGPLLDSLDIDTFLDPRATTVSTILQHVRRGRIRALHTVKNGAGEVIEAEALETSPLVGKPLRDTRLPDGVLIGAIVRKGQVISPRGETSIQAGDRVVIFAEREAVRKVERLFRVSLEFF